MNYPAASCEVSLWRNSSNLSKQASRNSPEEIKLKIKVGLKQDSESWIVTYQEVSYDNKTTQKGFNCSELKPYKNEKISKHAIKQNTFDISAEILNKLQESFEKNKIKSKSTIRNQLTTKTSKNNRSNNESSKNREIQTHNYKDNSRKNDLTFNIEKNPINKTKNPKKLTEYIEYLVNEEKKRIFENAKDLTNIKPLHIGKGGIPEYEEGYPKPGWCNDEDWKQMKKGDYADMKKHHRE
jgi:hypothetical protein